MAGDKHPFAALREVARERRAELDDEDAWVERAAGRAGPDDERALAAGRDADYVAHMMALTQPAAPEQLERLLGALEHQRPQAPVIPRPAPRRWHRAAVATALAAAAAVLLVVRGGDDASPLPPYDGVVTGADQTVRGGAEGGATTERRRISPGARVTLTAEPGEPLAKGHPGLAARLFLARGEELTPLPLTVEVSASGVARVTARYEALFGARSGAWDVVMFVAEPARLPDSSADAAEALAVDDPGLRAVRYPFELAP